MKRHRGPNVGKKVGGALYLHRSALRKMPLEYRANVKKASELAGVSAFNVIKFKADTISLLLYEDFDSASFPALLEAHTIDLSEESVTRSIYRGSDNPPILHRKELLLLPDDPRREMFASLTKSLEALGLFENTSDIGHRRQWENRLRSAKVTVNGCAVSLSGE
jgi:DNA phosphorothioation-associated putative methyltransferase